VALLNNPAALGKVAVAAAGTPVSILTNFSSVDGYANLQSNKITIQALEGNTGKVYIGYSNMVRATGVGVLFVLNGGETWSITDPSAANVFDVNKFFLDADSNGDAAYVSAHVR
jgi:glutamine cyclotransferase